ncbi:MAG TPA: two-component regulator propeller domain-containing protein [Vicinamibacterales bacterium]
MRFTCAVVLASVLWTSPVRAEDVGSGLDDYFVTTWSEKDGLPAGGIRSMEQGAEGALWLGTETGLVRFDGIRFVPFGDLRQGQLPSGAVEALLRARDGSLWVGMSGPQSAARLRAGRVTLFGEAEGLPNSQVTSLYEDARGAVWAASLAGLYRFDGVRWTHTPLPSSGSDSVLAIREDAQGRLWAIGPMAVFRRPSADAPFEVVERLAVASNRWQSLSLDRQGRMWMSDFDRGFRMLDAGKTSPPVARPRGWGVEILHDSRGSMWVATRGQGLWRVGETETRARAAIITSRDGLVNDAVQAVREDRDGNIWVGTPAGLQRLSPHRVTPVRDLGVVRVLEATPDGGVWVGTSHGLSRVSASGRRTFTAADGLPGSVVLTLQGDGAGGVWVATERGVARYVGGRFKPLAVGSSPMQRVFGMATPRPGDLWLRDFWFRLYHWRDGRMVDVSEVPEAHRRNVFALFGDRMGNVWIGGSAGRLGVRRADGSFQAYHLPIGAVMRLADDRDGAVWVGGADGLSRVTPEGVESLSRAQGFPGSVKAVVEDLAGDLWVGIGSGLIRIDKTEFSRAAAAGGRGFHYRFLNVADGMAGTPIAEGSNTGVRAADGRLWFATSGGATVVDPSRVGASSPLPPVRIESVTADGQQFDLATRLFEASRASHLHLSFGALTLTDPTRVRFRYRLEDFDHDWVDAGSTREASYTNLPPRQHRFLVEATNGDGIWRSGAAWEFGIAPMFYQTTWFYFLCAAGVVAAIAAGWRYRVEQVRQQFALVLGERIRMGREIHDTLLQGLAGLALEVDDLAHSIEGAPPGARERVLAMRKRVETYLREARLSIWDLRSPELASRDLAQALGEVGRRVIGDRPVHLDLVVNGPPLRCPPRVKEQLLLIGQEAVSNAIRHGNPTRVGVELTCEDDHARLRVSDDGRGFDPDSVADPGSHYGLRGMRERAEQVRGTVVIRSSPGHGTRVEAVVPTT